MIDVNNAHGVSASGSESSARERVEKRVSDVGSKVEDAVSDQHDRLERMVRRNPINAVGISAGIGFLLAFMARR